MTTLLIRCNSHRARAKVFRVIPDRNGKYSLRRSTGKGVYPVTLDEFEKIRSITGVTKYRDGDDLLGCWS